MSSRLLVIVASVAAAGIAALATADARASEAFGAAPSAKVGHIPAKVRAIADRLKWQPARRLSRMTSNDVRGTPTTAAALASPGYAHCAAGALQPSLETDEGRIFVWPVMATGHEAVVTRTHIFDSTTADFSSPLDRASPWFIIQLGNSFYRYEPASGIVSGPHSYADAWVIRRWFEPEDLYRAVVQEFWYADGGALSQPHYVLAPVGGPLAFNDYVCLN